MPPLCYSTFQHHWPLITLASLPAFWTVDQLLSFLQHTSISAALDDPHTLSFVIEHDWSDINPDPPDFDEDTASPLCDDSVF